MNIQVLGAGAWGGALGKVLERSGHRVRWSDIGDPTVWEPALDFAVLAIPSKFLVEALSHWEPAPCPMVSVIKGIEPEGFQRVSELLRGVWPRCRVAALSGPSFAKEVERGVPTAVVAASEEEALARAVQALFHQRSFRVYWSTDLAGVELGGALKNVYAVAAGLCSGLGLGANSLAAMVTRAMAEMRRLGGALGGRAETFMGLSGAGDLMLTCYDDQSRNRRVGLALAKGLPLGEIEKSLGGVAEGVTTSKAMHEIARRHGLRAPLIDQVFAVLHEGRSPAQALEELLARPPDAED